MLLKGSIGVEVEQRGADRSVSATFRGSSMVGDHLQCTDTTCEFVHKVRAGRALIVGEDSATVHEVRIGELLIGSQPCQMQRRGGCEFEPRTGLSETPFLSRTVRAQGSACDPCTRAVVPAAFATYLHNGRDAAFSGR